MFVRVQCNCMRREWRVKMGNEKFANRIKKLRTDRGLTLEGLANELNINKSRIGMWETNGTVPKDEVLIQLSKFFDVSIDFLLGNEKMEDKKPDKESIQYIQRGLSQLDEKRLEKAKQMLSLMFEDAFINAKEDDDGI